MLITHRRSVIVAFVKTLEDVAIAIAYAKENESGPFHAVMWTVSAGTSVAIGRGQGAVNGGLDGVGTVGCYMSPLNPSLQVIRPSGISDLSQSGINSQKCRRLTMKDLPI